LKSRSTLSRPPEEQTMNTRQRVTRLGISLIAAGSLIGLSPAMASGEGTTTAWGVDTTSRVFETYAEIPHAFYPGFPTTDVSLFSPGQCETIAAGYFAGIEVEEAIFGALPGYKNVTLARASNPDTKGYPNQAQVAPVGAQGGPVYAAECPSPDLGHGTARNGGFSSPGGSFGSGVSETTQSIDHATRTITSETATSLNDLSIGGSLRIHAVSSYLKTVLTPDAEPTITYRITLHGVSTGGGSASASSTDSFAVSDGGLTLAGMDIVGSEIIKQFNEQAKAHEKDLAVLARYGFRILAPKFNHDEDSYDVEAPVMDAGLFFPARQNQTGQGQALRIGLARFRGSYRTI
jgi:hypothetical protein